MTSIPNALTIAGSDSGGGAGIQADLKAFSANGVYGASVLTALTAQNTKGVTAIHDIPPDFIMAQLDAVFSDIRIDAVKIGMLSQVPVIETIAAALKKYNAKNIVFDPVMVATSGDLLLAADAVEAVKSILVPMANVITPNLHEAAKLSNMPYAQNDDAMREQAKVLAATGANSVLIKGGHGESDECSDLLFDGTNTNWFRSKRVETKNTHGTGCSLSSAIAANLALGDDLVIAVQNAKTWLTGAIASSNQLEVGQGSGPVHHFHNIWSK